MYTRNFETKGHSVKQGVPVECFDDSFSANAFLKSEKALHNQCTDDELKTKKENQTPCAQKSPTDELLIIGLILLLLGDNDKKENLLLTILLSLLLL